MTSFPVNTHRLDPYKNFKFRVVLDGKAVPNVTKVGPLKRRTATILVRHGGDFANHSMTAPGLTEFEPLVIERGITHDTPCSCAPPFPARSEGRSADSCGNS